MCTVHTRTQFVCVTDRLAKFSVASLQTTISMKNSKGMKFSKSLVKHFHNLVEVPTSMQKRISMLEEMEDFFGEDMFSYDSDDSRVLANIC